MVVHSVWDWKKLRYDYYVTPVQASVGGWKPLTGLGMPSAKVALTHGESPVGVDIEDVLPVLPSDARRVGQGVLARGQVCVHSPLRRAVGEIESRPTPSRRPDTLTHLSLFLAGMSAGAFFGKVNPVMIAALTTGALLTGINISSNGHPDGASKV